MSVSPPTQPTFIVGTQYSAPLSFFDTNGNTFPTPDNISASSSDPSVSVSISGSALLATMGTGGVTATLTVSATNSSGTPITATVTISDGPLAAPVLGSIGIGTFTPVAGSASVGLDRPRS
jgi:hypothetical protein